MPEIDVRPIGPTKIRFDAISVYHIFIPKMHFALHSNADFFLQLHSAAIILAMLGNRYRKSSIRSRTFILPEVLQKL